MAKLIIGHTFKETDGYRHMKHSVVLGKSRGCGHSRPVTVDGIRYGSVAEMRRKYGICETAVYSLRKQGLSYEEAISQTIGRKEVQREREARKRKEWEAEKALMEQRKEKSSLTYNGRTYRSLKDACRIIGSRYSFPIRPETVRKHAKEQGIPLREAFAKDVTKKLRSKIKQEKLRKKQSGKFNGLIMKEIWKLMYWYSVKGGIPDINSREYMEYLASEINVPKKEAEGLVESYSERFPKGLCAYGRRKVRTIERRTRKS